MRKGFIVGLLTIVTLCCGLYGIFVFLPRPVGESVITEAVAAGEKSFAASQVDATDPAKNGWLNPTFLPFWGRRDKESVPNSPVGKVITNWVEFTVPGKGEPVDHGKLLAAKDPQFLAAAAQFEKVAPELQKAMLAPRFVAPETKLSANNVVMNYIAVRATGQAMVGLSQLRLAQDKPSEAVDALLAPIVMSSHLTTQSAVIGDAIASAVSAIAIDGFACQISPRMALPASVWKRAAATFTDAVPSPDQLLLATQMEVAATQNAFSEASRGQSALPQLDAVAKAPGMLGREQRIYNNIMSDLLQDLQQRRPLAIEGLEHPATADFLLGRVGMVTQELVPGLNRMPFFLEQNRRRLVGLAATSAIAAYLAEKKVLPKDLEQARTVARIPDAATLTEIGVVYKVQGEQATLTIPQSGGSDIEVRDRTDYGPHPWYKIDNKTITWTI